MTDAERLEEIREKHMTRPAGCRPEICDAAFLLEEVERLRGVVRRARESLKQAAEWEFGGLSAEPQARAVREFGIAALAALEGKG